MELNLNKEELSYLLSKLDKCNDKSIYNKLEEAYLFIIHQENAVNILKQFYGNTFINCEYIHVDSNYKSGLMKYNIAYESINQETYQKEIIKDVEMLQFIRSEDIYNYILVFHKKEV